MHLRPPVGSSNKGFLSKLAWDNRLLIIILFYAFCARSIALYGVDFGSAWDEGYYALVTEKMVGGTYGVLYPVIYDWKEIVLIDKPPAFFWVGAFFVRIFGSSEFSFRLVSIIAGTASVLVFYSIVKYLSSGFRALISACVFASFPLHVAFSRVYYMEALVLFYSLLTVYLIVRGVSEKRDDLLIISSFLIGVNLLTKLWFGVAPVVGVLAWMVYKFRGGKQRPQVIKSVFALVAGFLIFLVWPVSISFSTNEYDGFRNGITSVWDMLFGFNLGGRFAGTNILYYLDRFLDMRYLNTGHLTQGLAFAPTYLFLASVGLASAVIKPCSKNRDLIIFYLIWGICFIPVHLGNSRLLNYLVILTPFFSGLICEGILGIAHLIRDSKAFILVVLLMLCIQPVYMIYLGNEIVYRSYYREMGDFLSGHTEGFEYGVVCRYFPAMTFYSKKPCLRTDTMKKQVREYIREGVVGFVELKGVSRDDPLTQRDKQWVEKNCVNINELAGVPNESIHWLYDCKK